MHVTSELQSALDLLYIYLVSATCQNILEDFSLCFWDNTYQVVLVYTQTKWFNKLFGLICYLGIY